LNDSQYVRFMRSTFYFAGLRILAPIREIYLLRSLKIKEDYTTLTRRVVDMTRVTKKGKSSKITRKIKVGVMTVRPFECILNSAGSLIKQGTLLKSTERFRSPIPLPAGVEGCRGARSLPRRALLEPRTPPPVLQPCAPPSAPQGWRSRRLPSPRRCSPSPLPPRAACAPVGAAGVAVAALASIRARPCRRGTGGGRGALPCRARALPRSARPSRRRRRWRSQRSPSSREPTARGDGRGAAPCRARAALDTARAEWASLSLST